MQSQLVSIYTECPEKRKSSSQQKEKCACIHLRGRLGHCSQVFFTGANAIASSIMAPWAVLKTKQWIPAVVFCIQTMSW